MQYGARGQPAKAPRFPDSGSRLDSRGDRQLIVVYCRTGGHLTKAVLPTALPPIPRTAMAASRSSKSRSAAPLPDPEAMRAHAGDAARLLKAIANEKRLQVLCLLAEGERSVGELNARLDLSQPALSQHLALLREDGLVQTRREAQTILYSLAPGPVQRILRTLHAIYCGDGG